MPVDVNVDFSGDDNLSGVVDRLSSKMKGLFEMKGFPGLGGELAGLAGKMFVLQEAALKVGEGLRWLKDQLVDAFQDAAKAEEAEIKFAASLKAVGKYTQEAVEDIDAFAEAQRMAAGTNDEMTKSLIAGGNSMGISLEQSKKFISLAADMAVVTGTLESNYYRLAMASTGNERAIKALGREFGFSAEKIKDFDILIAKILARVGGNAAEAMKGVNAQWKLFKDQLDELYETIGKNFLPAAYKLMRWLNDFMAELRWVNPAIDDLTAQIKFFVRESDPAKVAKFSESIGVTLTRSLNNAKTVLASWEPALQKVEKAYQDSLERMKKSQEEASEWMKKTSSMMSERSSGGEAISFSLKTEGEQKAERDRKALAMLNEAYLESGEKRVRLLNDYLKYYEAEAANEAAIGRKWADYYAEYQLYTFGKVNETDKLMAENSLQLWREQVMAEHARLKAWLEEEAASVQEKKNAAVAENKTEAEALLEYVESVKVAIADAKADAEKIKESINTITAKLKKGESVKIEAEKAKADLDVLNSQVESIDLQLKTDKKLIIDTDKAKADVERVKKLIDSIDGTTYKQVIVEFKTKASPVRPFSEGMDSIEGRLNSLPKGSSYTIGISTGQQVSGIGVAYQREGERKPAPAPTGATFAPVINVSGGPSAARDIDHGLADLWKTRRSKLRAAMEAA